MLSGKCIQILLVLAILINLFTHTNSFQLNRHHDRFSLYLNNNKPLAGDSSTLDRKELWKEISALERQAVELLSIGDTKSIEKAYVLLSQSVGLKLNDPFLQLATDYSKALDTGNQVECERLMTLMKVSNVPPHLASLVPTKNTKLLINSNSDSSSSSNSNDNALNYDVDILDEEVDAGSTFSDTVTEKIRVKINSFYDSEKSDPSQGKYMFWYKVGIYNEGPEPVQIVARMWEIEKCQGEKEVVRGAGIMSTQPIISPGDVFTYQSVCPLKVFPPKGKRILGSMSGAYTMCKGNMGQHNFTAKVGKFNLILPENKVIA